MDRVSRTRVKICGITRREDALAAVAAGADAIGLVFYGPSKRAVDVETARPILAALPPFITATALFVDEDADKVAAICAALPLDLLQFHGGEDGTYCAGFGRPYIKAVKVSGGVDIADQVALWGFARGVLLDTRVDGAAGGSGERFDWNLIPVALGEKIVLAGGLNPENVGPAVRQVMPYAVDVSSGVEDSPGIKSALKMRRFVQAVRAADTESGR